MATITTTRWFLMSAAIAGVLLMPTLDAAAHCDTMDGPVIAEARQALEKGDVTPILKWVTKDDEPKIREAFKKTSAVRSKGPEAKDLADRYFFETLVRIHREGEGVAYEGIKPAGTRIEPGIEAADKALESGSVDGLITDLTATVTAGIRERFSQAMAARKHKDESVEAGRRFVEAYVTFMHYVERLHQDATSNPAHHGGESPTDPTVEPRHDERGPATTEHTHEHD